MPLFKHTAWRIALVLLAIVYCLAEAGGKSDLYIFLSAAGSLHAQQNIYTTAYIDGYYYFYSVLFALFLEPFCYLPYFWVKFYWLLLNLGLYVHLLQLLANSKLVKNLPAKQQTVFVALVTLCSLRFLHDNIHASQITILILWCCVYGLCRIHQGKTISGSAILALGINIKLLPLVFLPYLLYRGFFKAFGCTLLFYAASLALPSLFIGHQYNISLLHSWLQLINPAQQKHVMDVDERSFHGLSTLLATLLVKDVPDMYALPIRRNIADVSLHTLYTILLIVRLALVSFTLFFLKWKPFVPARSAYHRAVEVSYLLLIIPLIFPHQQHYAFLFMVPAFAVVLYYLMLRKDMMSKLQQRFVTVFLAWIYLAGNLKILLGAFNQYYEHFKILTWSALLLIPLLVWASRGYSQQPLLVPEH